MSLIPLPLAIFSLQSHRRDCFLGIGFGDLVDADVLSLVVACGVWGAADIVFKYRQKVTRSFEHITGEYYIAPAFMVRVFPKPLLHLAP